MFPKPIRPKVLPLISLPFNCFFFHSPAVMLIVAWGILRAMASM